MSIRTTRFLYANPAGTTSSCGRALKLRGFRSAGACTVIIDGNIVPGRMRYHRQALGHRQRDRSAAGEVRLRSLHPGGCWAAL